MSIELMRSKSLLVDTSVLKEFFELLLEPIIRNQARRDQITRYMYLFRDKKLFVVPQILAELYSLLGRDAKKKRIDLRYWLNQLIPYLKVLIEEYIPKDEILYHKKFINYGFTDIALIKSLEKNDILLITTDFALINYCRKKGLKAYHPEEIFT